MNQETIEQIIWDEFKKQDLSRRYIPLRTGVSSAAQALASMWPQWVPVEDYLPTNFASVLVLDAGEKKQAYFLYSTFNHKHEGYSLSDVSHWIYEKELLDLLPTPPQTPQK